MRWAWAAAGHGWTAFAAPYGQDILRQWGIRTDYYAVMQLLLGYPRPGDAIRRQSPAITHGYCGSDFRQTRLLCEANPSVLF